MPYVLCVQGRFPGGSASIVKWAKRQSQTVEEEYEFYVFFFVSFSACRHCSKAAGRCRYTDTRGRWKKNCTNSHKKRFFFVAVGANFFFNAPFPAILSVELERVPTSAFNSYKAQSTSANDRRLHARTRWLPWRSENDSQHFRDMTLQAPPPFFYFNFFFEEMKKGRRGREGERVENLGQGDFFAVDRTTNRVQTPSPRYESSFVCPRCVKFWDDPLLYIQTHLLKITIMMLIFNFRIQLQLCVEL